MSTKPCFWISKHCFKKTTKTPLFFLFFFCFFTADSASTKHTKQPPYLAFIFIEYIIKSTLKQPKTNTDQNDSTCSIRYHESERAKMKWNLEEFIYYTVCNSNLCWRGLRLRLCLGWREDEIKMIIRRWVCLLTMEENVRVGPFNLFRIIIIIIII